MGLIAFDIGDKRVGVAVSELGMALPLETYWRKNFQEDLEYLAKLAESRKAEKIICGLPYNFDGSKSQQTLKTESFVEELKKHTSIPIEFEDERFTTLEARRILLEDNVSRKDRKNYIDKIAASYILEAYMNNHK